MKNLKDFNCKCVILLTLVSTLISAFVFAQGPPSTKFVEVNGTNQLQHNDTLLVGGHIKVENLSGGKKPGDMLVVVDRDNNFKKIPFPPEKAIPGQGGNPNAGTCVGTNIWQNTGDDIYKCPTTGNMGVGTTNAQKKLQITARHFTGISCDTSVQPPQCVSHQGMRLEYLLFNFLGTQLASSEWDLEPEIDSVNNLSKFQIGPPGKPVITFTEDGRVFIGDSTVNTGLHADWTFSTDGKVVARKFITTQVGWADDELKKELTMEDLKKEEEYVDSNSHLDGIPSGELIEQDGLDLTEMSSMQMRKIEQVFMYLFKFRNVINELKAIIFKLKKENSAFKKDNRELREDYSDLLKRVEALEEKVE